MYGYPMVAGVRKLEDLPAALASKVDTIFMMCGELSNIIETVKEIQKSRKSVYLHVDLIKGLAGEKEAISFLAEKVKPTGVVTTKSHLVKVAKSMGLLAVHHLFIIDTQALLTGIRNVQASQPDGVEIMPGLMPRIIREFTQEVDLPLIAGGLLKDRQEIEDALFAGANAVVSGNPALWNLELNKVKGSRLEEKTYE